MSQTGAEESGRPHGSESHSLPRHIAIIMDGNGRWAKARGLPRVLGHRAGMDSVRRVIEGCSDAGVEVLTLYAFYCENWHRPAQEIDDLMGLLEEYIAREIDELQRNGVRLNMIGRTWELPARIQTVLQRAIVATQSNRRLLLNLALSYGGRQELVDMARAVATDAKAGTLDPERIDEAAIEARLSTRGIPDPDLLIRTSGELRISNFLLWQISYSEIYVTDVLWPDFTRAELQKALDDYQRRERRFGRVSVSR